MGEGVKAGLQDRTGKLAAAARALNAASGARAPFHLAFLTDRRRGPDPLAVAKALPAGAAIILRDYDDPGRRARALTLQRICRERGVMLLIGGDAVLAREVGADGLHLRSDQLRKGLGGARLEQGREFHRAGGRLLTASCHSAEELERAGAIGADIAFLSPAFATASHPGAEGLGAEKFRRLAAASPIPVLALGGVDERNAASLAGPNVAGLAAIGAFEKRVANRE